MPAEITERKLRGLPTMQGDGGEGNPDEECQEWACASQRAEPSDVAFKTGE